MPENLDRGKFEAEYKGWMISMAKEAAARLNYLPSSERDRVIGLYKKYRDPKLIFRPLSDPGRMERLVGGKASSYVLMETDAVTFSPSMYSSIPGVLDFAVAMNRRFYYQGLWFPLISFNSEYVRRSDDRLMQYSLEHEFEMSRIYQEISLNLRSLSEGEKRKVVDSAQEISIERMKITQEELLADEKLMVQVSLSEPLIPKPYTETALLLYLVEHFQELKGLGVPSQSPDEEAFGKELLEEFQSWSEFSENAYRLFITELLSGLRDANIGYG